MKYPIQLLVGILISYVSSSIAFAALPATTAPAAGTPPAFNKQALKGRFLTAAVGATVSRASATNTTYFVSERGANYNKWFNVISFRDARGNAVVKTNHAYVELGTGLNYRDPATGQWLPSREVIEPAPGGAVAAFGEHKASFADNLNAANAIVVQMPDGQTLKSGILGLSYYDTASDQSVMIAEVKNCQGQIMDSNQVVYPDAFNGVSANVKYVYTKAGLEQDVVLLKQPPLPEKFGLSSASTVLQVLTEFSSAPQPQITTNAALLLTGKLADESLDFGSMRMVRGKAFLLGTNTPSAAVGKQWVQLNGRQLLVEGVPVDDIVDDLAALPPTAMNSGSSMRTHIVSGHLALPPQRLVKNDTTKTMMLAKTGSPAQGFMLDYQIINSGQINYTFYGDTTYYVSGAFVLEGTTTFEGGTVIKFAANGELEIGPAGGYSPGINWKGSAYRPVMFTAKDDDSLGDSISGSTGSPSGYYGNPMLSMGLFTVQAPLTGLRMSYAKTAILFGGVNANFYDAQFINCQTVFASSGANVVFGNALFANTATALSFGSGSTVTVQNSTFSGSTYMASAPPYQEGNTLYLYNCIMANVSTFSSGILTVNAYYNGFYNSPVVGYYSTRTSVFPFQTAGSGNYYLATNPDGSDASGFRGKGMTGILSGALLAGLKTGTTHPPVAFPALMQVSGNLTLFPQVPRYTSGAPDLGYYYPALDYTVAGIDVAGGNVTVEPGTAIAVQNEYMASQNLWTLFGFLLEQGSSFISHGTPTAPITFTSTKMVQEQPETDFTQYQTANGIPFSVAAFIPDYEPDGLGSPSPTLDFRFSNFYLPGTDYHIFGGWTEDQSGYFSPDSSVYLSLQDCNLYAGRVNLGLPYYTPGTDQYKDHP